MYIPRKYLRRLHFFMEKQVYSTLGMWRDYDVFSLKRLTLAFFLVTTFSLVQLILFFLTGTLKIYYTLYLVGVFLAAWFGGTRTAALTAVLNIVTGVVLFEPKIKTIFTDSIELFQILFYILASSVVTFSVTAVAQAKRYQTFTTNQLQKKEQHLAAEYNYIVNLIEAVSDGFVACDRDFVITYINISISKLLRKKQSRIMGQKVHDVFPETFVKKFQESYTKHIRNLINVHNTVFDWKFNKKWFSIHIYTRDKTVSIYFDDITLHKEHEKQKDFFVHAVSHELRTPITSIKLFLEIIRSSFKESLPTEVKTYVNKAENQLNKMTLLINCFLDLSRIERRSELVTERRKVNIISIIEESLEMFKFSIKYTIQVEPNMINWVYVDKERVTQVFVNLFSNAVKYSQNNDTLLIQLRSVGGMIEIAVTDKGVGIDRKYHIQIFKRFFKVEEKSCESYPGSGIGLYLSYKIVRGHYGKMWVKSKIGEGSTFYFTLPVYKNTKTDTDLIDNEG